MRSASVVRRIVTAFASLAILVVLTVGTPVVLWKLARWPLPAGLPTARDLTRALSRNGISDQTLLKTLALIGWTAWLQIVASIVVETVAWIRGRAAPHLRFAGTAQSFVCKLISSAALILGSTHVPSVAALPSARPIVTIASTPRTAVETPTAFLSAVDSPARHTIATDLSTHTKTYTVVRYDTLWGLAEKHLGNPLRWREIFVLDRGVRQSDGRALEDPNLIIPGWTLAFPADATGLADSAESRTAVPTPTPPNTAPATIPKRTHEAPVIHPPPPTNHPTLTTTAMSVPSATAATTRAPTPSNASHSRGRHRARRELDPSLLIGGGLAAASLVALLDRLRRVQRRKRRSARRPQPPTPAMESVEGQLRRAADSDDAVLLDLALRAFAAGTIESRRPPPTILAVRVISEQVEFLVDRAPEHPPDGFRATDDARGWITDPDLSIDDLRSLAAGAAAPLPALIALGDVEGGRLLIDIESAGTLTVDGDPERVSAFIRRIGVELGTSTWADHLDLLTVGTIEVDMVGAQRVQHFDDLDAALDELEAAARIVGDALDLAGSACTLEARLSDHPNDGWTPTILVCTEPIALQQLARLRTISGVGGRGTGAVVASLDRSDWHASIDETQLRLSPFDFRVTPAILDLPTARALDELLTDAAVGEPPDQLDQPPSDEQTIRATITEPYTDQPFEVEVQVLGPVEVSGGRIPLERRRCIDLAAYLALHPKGANDERLKTVVWGDHAPTTQTFNTTVSTTRSRLGSASDGTPHFPHSVASGNSYRLGPLVTTDLARFDARVAHARLCLPPAAIDTLRAAMDLVRGKPFEGARGYEWAFSEGLIANIEATIADAAHQLAQLYLDTGHAQEATWAATRGLVAAPGDEILYRDRMLACDLAGNPGGVESVMDELCTVVESLEPYDELHPETLELYERISHRKRTRAT
jgi:DNA-binding SARP family transcriptional activator